MKRKFLLPTLGLTLAIGLAAGISAKNNVREAKAASAGDTLTFYCDVTNASWWSSDNAVLVLQTWNGSADVQYPGVWLNSTLFMVENVDTTGWVGFKFVRHISDSANYDFSSWNTDFDNRFFTHAGSDQNGTWSNTTPTYVDTIVKVEFSSAVPEYVDIYLPGSFNGWGEGDISAKKMARVGTENKEFALMISNILVGSYQCKLVAEYANATAITWAHEIDATNQTLTVKESDHQQTIVLGETRTYDFAQHMPLEEIATGAAVQLTFENAVPTTVDIIFVGSLTSWGTTAERVAAGKMTPNAARTVFTWAIPEHTNVGEYAYKIVAMSAYANATSVSWDYVVYRLENNADAILNLDTTTTVYSLNALPTDLSELGAIGFAQGFNAAMATPCADQNANNKTAVSAIWGTWKDNFETLTAGSKSQFASSNNADVVKARTTYVHCVARYSLDSWTDAPEASRLISDLSSYSFNDSSLLIVIISAVVLTSACMLVVVLKKRKVSR